MKELMMGIRADLPPVVIRQRPIMLRRGTAQNKVRRLGDEIARVLAAEAVRHTVIAVVVHRDLDDVESSSDVHIPNVLELETMQALEPALGADCSIIPAIPAWETEAWWFLWPDQVAKHRPSWRRLRDRTGKWVDRIEHAKETLGKGVATGRADQNTRF